MNVNRPPTPFPCCNRLMHMCVLLAIQYPRNRITAIRLNQKKMGWDVVWSA